MLCSDKHKGKKNYLDVVIDPQETTVVPVSVATMAHGQTLGNHAVIHDSFAVQLLNLEFFSYLTFCLPLEKSSAGRLGLCPSMEWTPGRTPLSVVLGMHPVANLPRPAI